MTGVPETLSEALSPRWLTAARVLQGFFLWSITTKVEPGIIEILLHRMGTAAADFAALSPAEVVG